MDKENLSDRFSLIAENTLAIDDFPIRWVPLLNFFDPELPGFPLHRVHFLLNGNRIFGIPVTCSVGQKSGENCRLEIRVLSNVDLEEEHNAAAKARFIEELKERLGVSEAQDMESLKECCGQHEDWKKIVELIFPRLKKYYGNRIPCGQFYPELFGILRFTAAWATPGGRKQEIIMMSNVLATIGRGVGSRVGWEGINLLLLPTYEEVMDGSLESFENFQKLKNAVLEYGDAHLTDEYSTGDKTLYLLDRSKDIPVNDEKWNALLSGLSQETRKLLTQIKEDFNRNYQRPFVFITYFYNLFKGVDFSEWNSDDYARIIEDDPRGCYPKVLGCFLQQAFRKYGCIPIDIWVKSFFEEVLQTSSIDIPTSGRNLGKFERFVWKTVQLRKNNQPFFNDILFCIKTGVMHSKNIVNRKPNPLSCSLCSLDEDCPTCQRILSKKVIIVNRGNISTERGTIASPVLLEKPPMRIETTRKNYFDPSIFTSCSIDEADFVIIMDRQNKPEEVYVPKTEDRRKWMLVDNMSHFTIHRTFREGVYTVKDIISWIG